MTPETGVLPGKGPCLFFDSIYFAQGVSRGKKIEKSHETDAGSLAMVRIARVVFPRFPGTKISLKPFLQSSNSSGSLKPI